MARKDKTNYKMSTSMIHMKEQRNKVHFHHTPFTQLAYFHILEGRITSSTPKRK